ncbi:hypothetical protein BC629DRAFT_1441913 [Irpex lacteus]|nr:hypothetical protein BC629DRAFT_1441913 [Irpex lacteus]
MQMARTLHVRQWRFMPHYHTNVPYTAHPQMADAYALKTKQLAQDPQFTRDSCQFMPHYHTNVPYTAHPQMADACALKTKPLARNPQFTRDNCQFMAHYNANGPYTARPPMADECALKTTQLYNTNVLNIIRVTTASLCRTTIRMSRTLHIRKWRMSVH